MDTHSHIVLILFELLYWYTLTSSKVTWVLETDPVLFGGDVTLSCFISDNFNKSFARQWKTESTGLTFNEISADGNKYEGSLEKDGFNLTIKTFQVKDFGINYICSYGFEFYKANLTTENYLWIPPPDEYEVDVLNSTIEMMKFTLQFQKVYPKPNCTSLIGHKAIPTKFIASSDQVDRYFLAVKLTLEYEFDVFDCGEEVSILCKIGNNIITVNIPTLRQCAALCQRFSPCLNNGTCESNKSTIECDCMDGFNGKRCENSDTTAEDTVPDSPDTTNVVAVVIGLILVMCLIAVAAVIVGCRKYRAKSPSSSCWIFHVQKKESDTRRAEPSNGKAQCLKANLGNTNEAPPAEQRVLLM